MKLFVALLLTLETGIFRVTSGAASSSLFPSTMKVVEIVAAASFLAVNTVAVAAYEVPSNNLIKELADEYNDAETVEMAFAEDIEEMIDTSSSSSAPGLLRGRISSFEEKKRVKDLNYWLACESGACADTKFWEEKMKELTSGPDKRNALKHLREAIAATLRAEAHLSNDFMPAWEAFKEKHGAAKAEQWADNWEDSHEIILSYNEEDGDVFEVKRPIVIYCESIKE